MGISSLDSLTDTGLTGKNCHNITAKEKHQDTWFGTQHFSSYNGAKKKSISAQ